MKKLERFPTQRCVDRPLWVFLHLPELLKKMDSGFPSSTVSSKGWKSRLITRIWTSEQVLDTARKARQGWPSPAQSSLPNQPSLRVQSADTNMDYAVTS